MLTVRTLLDPTDLSGAHDAIARALATWSLSPHRGRAWVERAALDVGDAPAELVVEYDADLALVSVEAWRDGARLFGLDDWMG